MPMRRESIDESRRVTRGNISRPRRILWDICTRKSLTRLGIIYFGHGASRSEYETKVLKLWAASLSRRSGFPILAEFTSNMRGSSSDDGLHNRPLGAYESYISSGVVDLESIEVLIRFGAPPLSRNMQVALEQAESTTLPVLQPSRRMGR